MRPDSISAFISEAAKMVSMAGRMICPSVQPMGDRAMRGSLRESLRRLAEIVNKEEKST